MLSFQALNVPPARVANLFELPSQPGQLLNPNTFAFKAGEVFCIMTFLGQQEMKSAFKEEWTQANANMEKAAAMLPKILECMYSHRGELGIRSVSSRPLYIKFTGKIVIEETVPGMRPKAKVFGGTYEAKSNTVTLALGDYNEETLPLLHFKRPTLRPVEKIRDAAVHEFSHYLSLNGRDSEFINPDMSMPPVHDFLEGLNQWAEAKFFQFLYQDKVGGFEELPFEYFAGGENPLYRQYARDFAGILLKNGFRQTMIIANNPGGYERLEYPDWKKWAQSQGDAAGVEALLDSDLASLKTKLSSGLPFFIDDAARFDRISSISNSPNYSAWAIQHKGELEIFGKIFKKDEPE